VRCCAVVDDVFVVVDVDVADDIVVVLLVMLVM